MRQRHRTRQGPLAAADHADIGNGMVGGAEGAGGDDGGTPTGETLNAMDPRGLQGLGEVRRRQEGGEPGRQLRRIPPELLRRSESGRERPQRTSRRCEGSECWAVGLSPVSRSR
jgi:hypothetical protein